jgi:phosphonoacetaldehyde hydrolase
MSMIKAVVFDWAGTMVDFGCQAPVEALVDAFASEGVSLSPDDARRDMGRAKRDHVAALMAHPPVAEAWMQAKGVPHTDEDVERVYRALEPLMARSAARFTDLIPGAAAVAAKLRAQGVRIGSGTGYTREMMSEILPRAATQGYSPEVVICAGETPSGRPSPLMLWQALILLDAWPARFCIKVDDAEVGMQEGRAAGCWTVGLAASGNGVGLGLDAFQGLSPSDRRARVERAGQSLKVAGAHLVIDTVADFPSALTEIERRIAAGHDPAQD